jgi:predicted restriction endonuclease
MFGILPEWVEIAERTSTRNLRKMVRREMTKRSTGEDVVDLKFHATETTREHFERARVLASRKAGKRLSADATFRVVVEDYVSRHDPLEVEDGTRRVGPTSGRPRDRYVPVRVRRDVRRRAGDRCEFPGCEERTFLEFAHRRPHRHGSGREADDLLLQCWLHHPMFDAGRFRVVGPTDDPSWVQTGLGDYGYVCTRDLPGGRAAETDEERRALRELLEARRRERGPP